MVTSKKIMLIAMLVAFAGNVCAFDYVRSWFQGKETRAKVVDEVLKAQGCTGFWKNSACNKKVPVASITRWPYGVKAGKEKEKDSLFEVGNLFPMDFKETLQKTASEMAGEGALTGASMPQYITPIAQDLEKRAIKKAINRIDESDSLIQKTRMRWNEELANSSEDFAQCVRKNKDLYGLSNDRKVQSCDTEEKYLRAIAQKRADIFKRTQSILKESNDYKRFLSERQKELNKERLMDEWLLKQELGE